MLSEYFGEDTFCKCNLLLGFVFYLLHESTAVYLVCHLIFVTHGWAYTSLNLKTNVTNFAKLKMNMCVYVNQSCMSRLREDFKARSTWHNFQKCDYTWNWERELTQNPFLGKDLISWNEKMLVTPRLFRLDNIC
jgi:hypothetical protein